MFKHSRLTQVEDYAPFIAADAVERILEKAKGLQGLHVAHVNSTYYGGGVATLLDSLTCLMNSVGIKTGWRIIQGVPDFFSVTKKMHNALQGTSLLANQIEGLKGIILHSGAYDLDRLYHETSSQWLRYAPC